MIFILNNKLETNYFTIDHFTILFHAQSYSGRECHKLSCTKNAVMYEVNVRQFTPEGTFNAFSNTQQELRN